MSETMPHTCIMGTGSSIPKRILSNKDLECILDTTDEWITRRTGIKERRISSKSGRESSTDLTTQASIEAMEIPGISHKSPDMILGGHDYTGSSVFLNSMHGSRGARCSKSRRL